MSEQNSMAISPVAAGLTGAAIGGFGNYFLGVGAKPKEGYRNTTELLTLKDDEFKKLADKVNADGDDTAKAEFKKLEDGRKIVSNAGDSLEKDQKTARAEMNAAIEKDLEANLTGDAKTKFADAVKTEKEALTTVQGKVKTTADALKAARNDDTHALKKATDTFRKAFTDEVSAITNKKDSGLGKKLADLEAELSKETDATKKADIEKNIKATKNEIAKEALDKDTVKNARKAMRDEKAKIFTEEAKTNAKDVKTKKEAYNKKLVDSADEALKDVTAKNDGNALEKLKALVEEKKAVLTKKVEEIKDEKAKALIGDDGVDGVKLKDLDTGKFKKFLPKAKMWPAVIAAAALGAAGVALAYIVGPKNETPSDVA